MMRDVNYPENYGVWVAYSNLIMIDFREVIPAPYRQGVES